MLALQLRLLEPSIPVKRVNLENGIDDEQESQIS